MVLRHGFFYLLARAVPGLVSFAAIGVFSRLLGDDGYGAYALTLSYAGLANIAAYQWLRWGIARYRSGHDSDPGVFLSTVFWTFVLLSAVLALGGTVAALLAAPALRPYLVAGTVLLIVQAWFLNHLEFLRAELQPLRYGLTTLVKAVLTLALGVLLVRAGLGPLGVVYGLAIGLAVAAFVPLPRYWRTLAPRWDSALVRRFLRYGLPLTATAGFNFIIASSDRILLGWLQGVDAAGVYSAGYDLTQQSLGMLMSTTYLASYPLAVKAFNARNFQQARQQLRSSLGLLWAIGLPAAVVVVLHAPLIARVVVGEELAPQVAGFMPWVALAIFLSGLKSYLYDLPFQLAERTELQTRIIVVAAAVNALLNLVLIPRWGVLGAAWATVAGYGCGLALSYWLGRTIFPVPPARSELAKTLVAVLAMAAAMALVEVQAAAPWQLLIEFSAGGLSYALAMLALDFQGLRRTSFARLRALFYG